jgi:eukaryotic-like serine/threonine-protein kinase
MATVLPKAERGLEMQATRVSMEPPNELVSPPSRRPYGPGDVIDGKYELESLLGRGGMGEVWTARNTTLDVRRAVKLIRADSVSAESADRLLYEAQSAARLAEPSIVRVFDFGKTEFGDPYLVMEMLEGEDLMSIIKRRERLSPSKAVRVLLPVIRALVAAHTHGIVHRDLKPENIFLAKLPDGRVQPKLLDFGIAKLKNAQALRLTTAGAVMGSPLYMAPEQARGEDVDERADIWAICVVLYEAITGNPPFSGADRAQVVRAAADSDPVRLSQHGVVDDSLWPIISRGLSKQRDDRWASMEELGRTLARWLLDGGTIDDVTGASLEAGWFRSHRQSLFSSSTPPRSGSSPRLIAAAKAPRHFVGLAEAWLGAAVSRARPALGRVRARLDHEHWRRAGVLLVLLLTVALALRWLVGDEPDTAAVSPAPVEAVAPAASLASTEPASAPALADALPQGNVNAAPLEPAVAARSGGSPASAPTRAAEPARSRRKSAPRAEAAKDLGKERRRSQLIDPYR